MTRDKQPTSETGAEAAEPSPGEVATSERDFLRRVRHNMEVDAADELDGAKAQADRSKRSGPRRTA